MITKIIVASNNKNKIREIKSKLADMDIEVLSQREAGFDIDDDGGLEVDFLDGGPGVYSARFCGPDASDKDKYMKILEMMKDVEDEKRTARFRCVITYIDELGEAHAFEGRCDGKIAREPMGENDFGYDPIFLVGDKSFAQISEEDKNKISHRGRAIDKWVEYLKKNN